MEIKGKTSPYCQATFGSLQFMKIQNFQDNCNKFCYAYLLTPQGIYEKSKLTAHFLNQKMKEYEVLKAEIKALEDDLRKNENI